MKPKKPYLGPSLFLCCIALVGSWPLSGRSQQRSVQSAVGASNAPGVVGLWRAIDDKAKKPSSLIRLQMEDNKVVGQIEKILNTEVGPHPVCVKCRGERAMRPLEGMKIIWDLVADDKGYSGGEVLDPGSGSTYRCRMRLLSRNTLEVRGYLGFSAFGRSQIWQREPEAALGGAK